MNRKSFLKSLMAAIVLSPVVCRMAESISITQEEVWYFVSPSLIPGSSLVVVHCGTKEEMESLALDSKSDWWEVTNRNQSA